MGSTEGGAWPINESVRRGVGVGFAALVRSDSGGCGAGCRAGFGLAAGPRLFTLRRVLCIVVSRMATVAHGSTPPRVHRRAKIREQLRSAGHLGSADLREREVLENLPLLAVSWTLGPSIYCIMLCAASSPEANMRADEYPERP